jgi:DNA-binding Lrp family transcriptional regulator
MDGQEKNKGLVKMLKQSDIKFIAQLRENARQTLTEISKKTKIPISTLYDKLKLQEGTVITKHTTLLDFSKIGYNCRANIMLRPSRDCREKLMSYLKAHQSINNLYKINNGYDYLAEGIFPNVKEMEEFMEDLEQKFVLEDKKAHYIIEDLKREEFMNSNAQII